MRLGLITLIAAGCSFRASYDGTHYQCGAGDTCPSGQTCVAGECVLGSFDASPGTPDAPVSTPDAPIGTPDAAVAQARCGSVGLLRDGFDNGVTAFWGAWHDNGPTVTVANSRLAIALPSGTGDLWGGLASAYRYDLTNSRVEVTVSQVGGVDTVLEVRGLAGGKMQMVVESGVLFAFVGTGSSGATKAQITYDPQVHKRWRIREDSGTAYWEWSTDGVTWTELWHQADPFSPEHVQVQLSAGGLLASASEAHFENINVDVNPALGFCAASSLVDDFSGSAFGPQWNAWADPHAAITMTTSSAVMTTDGTPNVWSGFNTIDLFQLTDSTIYMDATMVPQQSPYVAWMQVNVPNGDRLEIDLEGTTLYFYQHAGGTDVNSKTMSYDPVAHRYWRLRADATNVYIDTSPDAVTWTTRFSPAKQIDTTAVQLDVGGGEYQKTGVTLGAQLMRVGGVDVP